MYIAPTYPPAYPCRCRTCPHCGGRISDGVTWISPTLGACGTATLTARNADPTPAPVFSQSESQESR